MLLEPAQFLKLEMLMVSFPRLLSFFNYSPKRQHFFEHVIDAKLPNMTKKKLNDLCKTCWVQGIESYTVFYDLYAPIIKPWRPSAHVVLKYDEWSWDTETLTKASGFLHQLLSFEFLVTFNESFEQSSFPNYKASEEIH